MIDARNVDKSVIWKHRPLRSITEETCDIKGRTDECPCTPSPNQQI
jgi:hypothetical protein